MAIRANGETIASRGATRLGSSARSYRYVVYTFRSFVPGGPIYVSYIRVRRLLSPRGDSLRLTVAMPEVRRAARRRPLARALRCTLEGGEKEPSLPSPRFGVPVTLRRRRDLLNSRRREKRRSISVRFVSRFSFRRGLTNSIAN